MKKFIAAFFSLILIFQMTSCNVNEKDKKITAKNIVTKPIISDTTAVSTTKNETTTKKSEVAVTTTALPKTDKTDTQDDIVKIARSLLNDTEKQLYDKYLPQILSYKNIHLPYSDSDFDTLHKVFEAIRKDYPEINLFFSFGITYDDFNSKEVSMDSTYFSIEWSDEGVENFDQKFVDEYLKKMYDRCDSIVKQMPSGLSTKEKYEYLADYICTATEYTDNEDGRFIYADGPLLYGKGLCQSYAQAFKLLCRTAGLWCITCAGGAHEWNVVKLDNGKTYYMDLTWEDDTIERKGYFYFMTYDECINSGHELDEDSWIADGD